MEKRQRFTYLVCRVGLPDIRKWRRLSSSLNVLDGLKDVTAQLGYGALLPSDREDGDPPSMSSECHICRVCYCDEACTIVLSTRKRLGI